MRWWSSSLPWSLGGARSSRCRCPRRFHASAATSSTRAGGAGAGRANAPRWTSSCLWRRRGYRWQYCGRVWCLWNRNRRRHHRRRGRSRQRHGLFGAGLRHSWLNNYSGIPRGYLGCFFGRGVGASRRGASCPRRSSNDWHRLNHGSWFWNWRKGQSSRNYSARRWRRRPWRLLRRLIGHNSCLWWLVARWRHV